MRVAGASGLKKTGVVLAKGTSGTGKTTLLVQRAIDLADSGEKGIMLVVRDRRLAALARTQIAHALGATDAVAVGSPHSLALGLLRIGFSLIADASDEDPPQPPALLSAPEQFGLVREMLEEPAEAQRWEAFGRARNHVSFIEELRRSFARAQDADELPEQLEERARMMRRDDLRNVARAFRSYLTLLDNKNATDHPNAICQVRAIMNVDDSERPDAPAIKEAMRARVQHLLVDDLQATSTAMLNMFKSLLAQNSSLWAALDTDAPSFAFRGGNDDPEAAFELVFPHSERLLLSDRKRPTPELVAHEFPHSHDELRWMVADMVRAHTEDGVAYSQMMIILRALGTRADQIKRELKKEGIPVQILGENRALKAEPALQSLIALVKVAFERDELDNALPTLLASPAGGFGVPHLRALVAYARANDLELSTVLSAPPGDLPEGLAKRILALRRLVEELRDRDSKESAAEVAWWIWSAVDVGQKAAIAEDDHEALDAFTGFFREFDKAAERRKDSFSGVITDLIGAEFGPEWSLGGDREREAITVLTAYSALGRDAELVYVPTCLEGNFPDTAVRTSVLDIAEALRPLDDVERRRNHLVSERRLFDAVLARGRGRVVISYPLETADGRSAGPSPYVTASGIEPTAPGDQPLVLKSEYVAFHRRRLLDRDSSEQERDDSLTALARVPGLDAGTWWWERDWSDPGASLHEGEFKTSYSRLSPYDNCPLSYLYQTELGLGETVNHSLSVGNWIHRVIELAEIDMRKTGKAPPIEVMLQRLDEVWDSRLFPSLAIEDRRRRESEAMLQRFLNSETGVTPVGIESRFEFKMGPAVIRGAIDRIDETGGGRSRIIDYKTSNYYKSANEVAEDLQLSCYGLAMSRDEELAKLPPPLALELVYPGIDANGGCKHVTAPFRKDRSDDAVERLENIIAGIVAEQFEPSPEADCQFCSFKSLCPLWPQGEEVSP